MSKSVLDFPAISGDLDVVNDQIYVLRGTGTDRDRRIIANKLKPVSLSINTTQAVDISQYGDLIIISTPTADITITLNNINATGRRIIIHNQSVLYTVTLTGASLDADYHVRQADAVELISDGADIYRYDPSINHPTSGVFRNLIMNSCGAITQRGTTFTSTSNPPNDDGNYLFDRWVLLSDGNDIVDVLKLSSAPIPSGSRYYMVCQVETANAKFGKLQIIEADQSIRCRGKRVSLSFTARTASGFEISNIRAAVLSWSGSADSPTKDVVSAWNAAGSDPTLVTNWAYCNTPSNMALAGTWNRYTIENISVPSNTNNLAVFIWVDDDNCSINDIFALCQVQLNEGPVVLPFSTKSLREVLDDCQRYCWRQNGGDQRTALGTGFNLIGGSDGYFIIPLAVDLRRNPSMIVSAQTHFEVRGQLTVVATNTVNQAAGFPSSAQLNRIEVYAGYVGSLTAGDGAILYVIQNTAYFIEFDAEIGI